MSKPETITIDDVKYVRADSVGKPAKTLDGKEYVICRTYSAGVFAGYMDKREGKEATVLNARRLWYWDGAASLSQLAVDGTKKPSNCKFPCEVERVELTEVIEVIQCTEKSQISIQGVPVWEQ